MLALSIQGYRSIQYMVHFTSFFNFYRIIYFCKIYHGIRGISSNGRAIALHAIGSGIDTRILHFLTMLRNIIFVFDLNNLIDAYAIYFEKLFKWRNTSLNLVWIFLLLVCARFPKYGVGFVITFLTMHPIKLARILQLPNQAGHNESLPGAPRSYLDSAALNLAAYTKSLFDCWATYWNSEEERYFFRFLPFQIYGCVCALLFIVWDLHDCISAALLFPFIYFTAPRYMNPLKFAMEVHHLLCIAAEIVNFRRTAILNRIDQVDLVDHGQRLCWKVEVMENQRWWAGIGWSDGMLQGDPGQWSSITGISRRQGMEFYQALEPYGKGPWAAGSRCTKKLR